MIRILSLDWGEVPQAKKPYVVSKLVKYAIKWGGLLSDCNTFFVVDGLEDNRRYSLLRNIFVNNGLKAFENVSVLGEGQGRLF